MAFNLADCFERVADAVPDNTALVCADRRLTYGELDERANRLAHHLTDAGVGPGDHIGIQAYNCVEWMETFIAAFKLRAAAININFRYTDDELRYVFDDADLKLLVHGPDFDPPFDSRSARSTSRRWRRRHPSVTSASGRATTSTSSTPAVRRVTRRG